MASKHVAGFKSLLNVKRRLYNMDMVNNTDMNNAADGTDVTQMPDGRMMDEEMRNFMAEGYIMGADCFGVNSRRYADRLMEFINDEYADSIYYSILAQRAPDNRARRIFRNFSADELRHAKRFAATYFLITGKRYFPTKTTIEPVKVPPVYEQALRQRYLSESRDAVKYQMFARQISDRCLKRIAVSTSIDEKKHAQTILELIQAL